MRQGGGESRRQGSILDCIGFEGEDVLPGARRLVRGSQEFLSPRVAWLAYHHDFDGRAEVIHQRQRVGRGEQTVLRGLSREKVERRFRLVAEVGPLGEM